MEQKLQRQQNMFNTLSTYAVSDDERKRLLYEHEIIIRQLTIGSEPGDYVEHLMQVASQWLDKDIALIVG